jgi:hypothetical protein
MSESKAINLLKSWQPFEYDQKIILESREANGGKIMLKGILQKSDVLNQNGRIYPLEILEREVRNYQKFINENRALGECVDEETKIVVGIEGLDPVENFVAKSFEELTIDDLVLTKNLGASTIEAQRILSITKKPYSGKMLHFRNEDGTIDMKLTPEHKVLLLDKSNAVSESHYLPARKLYDLLISGDEWLESCYISYIDGIYCGILQITTVEEVHYDGMVYCVTTENGNWLAQRNGHMFFTGNCDHPDSSVVNLKNASHIIRKAYMENGVVYGTIELLNTPSGKILQSLVESGITLGISSRGLGSTVEKGDYQIVQDDFQLICWDFVSEPSTPGAFMMKESLDATRAKKMMAVFDKSDRVYRAVTDILNW